MSVPSRLSSLIFAAFTWLLVVLGCQPLPPDRPEGAEKELPQAYASRHFNDKDLQTLTEEFQSKGLAATAPKGKKLFGRVEVLPPVPTVQPYGVGVFQQEIRLPVILTTAEGWSALSPAEKETKVADLFNYFSERLKTLKHDPVLRPTLTVQTPQGMELSWINHLDPSGKNVHGDD